MMTTPTTAKVVICLRTMFAGEDSLDYVEEAAAVFQQAMMLESTEEYLKMALQKGEPEIIANAAENHCRAISVFLQMECSWN